MKNCYCQVVAGPKISGMAAGACGGRGGADRGSLQTNQLRLLGVVQYAVNIVRNPRERQESLRDWWRRQKEFDVENPIWYALL